ncbi:DNA-binding protein [Methylobacter sp.]
MAEWLLGSVGGSAMSQDSEAYYNAQELAGLAGMPETRSGINRLAKRNNWPYRPHSGRGGGREHPESCLPKETRKILIKRQMDALDTDIANLKLKKKALKRCLKKLIHMD